MNGILQQRDIVECAGALYRILEIDDDSVLAIMMNTSKTNILKFNRSDIENDISCGVAKLRDEHKDNIRYIHPEMLRGAAQRIYNQYKNTGEAFLQHAEYFDWLLDKQQKAQFIEEIAEQNEISITTARRRLRDYLQNGMTLRGLESKYYNCGGKGKERVYNKNSRPGRKGFSTIVRDAETIVIFDKMVKRYMALHGKRSISGIYTDMLKEYYTEKIAVDAEMSYIPYSLSAMPTKKQLYYHFGKRLGSVEEYIIRNGYKDAKNNKRPLYSDTIHALEHHTIGDSYELDEMETDYELVSSYDRNQVIGRGIMYLIIDVFSKMITGYAVGIDNNSWAGVEMALLNMAEDKVKHCAKRGIQISQEDWPVCHVLPRQIMVDNGAEYLSEQFKLYGAENGLCFSFAESKMGSMKGNIEGEFRRFNLKTNGLIPGQIVKNSYRKPHERQARLTIEEFEQVVITFIINHNKNPMDSYKANKEIFASGIIQSPNKIWEYCWQHSNQLKKITDMDAYRLSLLCDGKASITREGIRFKKMLYICNDESWLSYEMGRAAIENTRVLNIKYDKRCLDTIFYLSDDGTYKVAFLNERKTINEKYFHLSYDEVVAVDQRENNIKRINANLRITNDLKFLEDTQSIVQQANKKHSGVNNNKNKQQTRMDTKERLHQEHNVISELGTDLSNMIIQEGAEDRQKAIECQRSIEDVKKQKLLELMNVMEE